MSTPESNDPLDALLKDDIYIEDDGFTSRVMAGLPHRRGRWLRPAILFGAALIGFALLAWWLPPINELFVMEPDGAVALQFTSRSLWTAAAMLAAMGSLVCGVLAATRED